MPLDSGAWPCRATLGTSGGVCIGFRNWGRHGLLAGCMVVIMNASPSKYFALPPYKAKDLGGDRGWWGVMNRSGVNCLTFPDKPGAVVTTEERAKQIADEWNETKETS